MDSAQSTESVHRVKSSFWALPFRLKLNTRHAQGKIVPAMKYEDD